MCACRIRTRCARMNAPRCPRSNRGGSIVWTCTENIRTAERTYKLQFPRIELWICGCTFNYESVIYIFLLNKYAHFLWNAGENDIKDLPPVLLRKRVKFFVQNTFLGKCSEKLIMCMKRTVFFLCTSVHAYV